MSSLFSSFFFTSQQEQVQQEFNLGIQPLRSRKWMHFNWSHILFIDGEFHPTRCLPKDVFKEILQFNDMEMLINQIFSLLFVAADRCKESVSPKAQLTLRNGIVLIYQMMRNYVQLYWNQRNVTAAIDNSNNSSSTAEYSLFSSSDLKVPDNVNISAVNSGSGNFELLPPNFSNDFFKNMVRILLLSGDERVFRPDVIESSNFLFAFLLNDKLYGPLFLIYINDLRIKNSTLDAIFLNQLDRLLCYQKREELHICLPSVYSLLWSLLTYNNFQNRILQEMIPQRRNENKNLNSLLSLFLLHISKYSMHASRKENALKIIENTTLTNNKPLIYESMSSLLGMKQFEDMNSSGGIGDDKKEELMKRYEFSICNYSLKILFMFTLMNTEFRSLFFNNSKSVHLFWDMLLSRVSQDLNKNAFFKTLDDQQWLLQSLQILKLVYLAIQDDGMRVKLLTEFVSEKQDKDLLESILFSNANIKEAIVSGRLLSFIKWLTVVSINNIKTETVKYLKKSENATGTVEGIEIGPVSLVERETMVFVDTEITILTMRMFITIINNHRGIFFNEMSTISDLNELFLSCVIVNMRTVANMADYHCEKFIHLQQRHENVVPSDRFAQVVNYFREISNITISIITEIVLSKPIEVDVVEPSDNNSAAKQDQSSSTVSEPINNSPSSSSPNNSIIEKNKQLLTLHRSLMKYEKSVRFTKETMEKILNIKMQFSTFQTIPTALNESESTMQSDNNLIDNLIQLVAYCQYFKNRYGDK